MKTIFYSLSLGFMLYCSALLAEEDAPEGSFTLNVGLNSANTPDLALQQVIGYILRDLALLPSLTDEQQQLREVLLVTVDRATDRDVAKAIRVAISAKLPSAEIILVNRLPSGMDLSEIGRRLSILRRQSRATAWRQAAPTTQSNIAFNHVLPGDLMAQRWNTFFNANIGNLQQTNRPTEAGFDSNIGRYMLGGDYRLMNRLFIGMAGALVNADADFDNSAGTLKVKEISLTGYSTYHLTDNWYLEASGSYGYRQFDLERNLTIINQVAKSDPRGKVGSIHVGGGYEQQWANGINMTVAGAINYFRATIETFKEQEGGGLNLSVDPQDIRGRRLNATISINRAFNQAWGVIIPQFQIGLVRDTKASQQTITARFVHDPGQNTFSFDTQAPDNQYLEMSASGVIILPGGMSGFLQYQRLSFIDNIRQSYITLGARVEF